jgi:hypothetical protein
MQVGLEMQKMALKRRKSGSKLVQLNCCAELFGFCIQMNVQTTDFQDDFGGKDPVESQV